MKYVKVTNYNLALTFLALEPWETLTNGHIRKKKSLAHRSIAAFGVCHSHFHAF